MEVADLSYTSPKDFMTLGFGSLKNIVDLSFRPRHVNLLKLGVEDLDYDREIKADIVDGKRLEKVGLHPILDDTPVFGIDTSSIELGETKDGILCAVRGSVVWRYDSGYQYTRYGPFIFHITETNKRVLYNKLRQAYFGSRDAVTAPSLWWMPGRIRNVLERWLQNLVCQSCRGSLLLWDGSLTAWTFDSPVSVLSETLHAARNRGNVVLAFSKKTRLYVADRRIADLIDDRETPCLLKIDDAIRLQYGSSLCFFGRVYAAKLAPGYFTFRLDVDREVPEEEGIHAVERLIGNDLVIESYPETLRLAHITTRFSASEVIGMQRYIAENYGMRIVGRPDVRQVLFGPYAGASSQGLEGERVYDAHL